MSRLNFALTKGYTIRVSRQVEGGHRGLELKFLYATTLERALEIKQLMETTHGVIVSVLQPSGKWLD